MAVARPAAFAQMLLVLVAYVVLTVAFVMQDFSVRYVAENSNSLLPLVYRYTAVWGSHEGSLLLWTLRSEEHTSELESLMRISYAVFCLKKKNKIHQYHNDATCRNTLRAQQLNKYES